jgi:hypothetical protein
MQPGALTASARSRRLIASPAPPSTGSSTNKCLPTSPFKKGSENPSLKSNKRIGRIATIRPFQKVWVVVTTSSDNVPDALKRGCRRTLIQVALSLSKARSMSSGVGWSCTNSIREQVLHHSIVALPHIGRQCVTVDIHRCADICVARKVGTSLRFPLIVAQLIS